MDACDVLIVGGGPAGSSCARRLRQAGLDTVILDKQTFPRNKVCGGWITPTVVDELAIDLDDYARTRVLQPLTAFRTSRIGDSDVLTAYGKPVSYGIRRCEFDTYLLERSGARIMQGMPLKALERSGESWIINGEIRAQLVVGAGGHFCPVARFLGADARKEIAVAAQEIEFPMTPDQQENCSIRGEVPELFFCEDMKGYGWCLRKQNHLNVGLGRLDPHGLRRHVSEFLAFLKSSGKVPFDLPAPMAGHAYLLYSDGNRRIVDNGILLIGDAAGVAYAQSGEGIRPAVESGLLAARVIAGAQGKYTQETLAQYRDLLASRFAEPGGNWLAEAGSHLPAGWIRSLARMILSNGWFSRHVVLDRWFLHQNEPALNF